MPPNTPSRDPDHITGVLDAVEQYWQDNPDFRLGQLITIMASQAEHNDGDPFYLEGDKLLRQLSQALNTPLDNNTE